MISNAAAPTAMIRMRAIVAAADRRQ